MRVNYLNNKDILKEIHKSKNSYSSYTLETFSDYDFIVSSLADIPATLQPYTVTTIDAETGIPVTEVMPPKAKVARAKRLTVAAQDASLATGVKLKADEVGISHSDIADTDVVYRVMLWDHIPSLDSLVEVDEDEEIDLDLEPVIDLRTEKAKHVKLNFPPFQHYKLDANGDAVCVGKSHWQGDIDTGKYNRDHGQMTNKLAHMFIKLCERYATRSNWRGYTYNDEMRSQALLQLSQIGLQFDESKSQNPFAYYTAVITNSFTRVLNVEKGHQNVRDDILEINGMNPSYTRQGMSSGGGGGDGGYEE